MGYVSHLSPVNILNISATVPENRGFAYCFEQPDLSSSPEVVEQLERQSASLTVENQQLIGTTKNWQTSIGLATTFFEADKFIYYYQQFYLESTGGDV
jgi:hypothetical protein